MPTRTERHPDYQRRQHRREWEQVTRSSPPKWRVREDATVYKHQSSRNPCLKHGSTQYSKFRGAIMETGRLRRGSGATQEGQVEVQVTSETVTMLWRELKHNVGGHGKVGETAQEGKALAANPDNLSVVRRTHMSEGGTNSHTPSYTPTSVPAKWHTLQVRKYKRK